MASYGGAQLKDEYYMPFQDATAKNHKEERRYNYRLIRYWNELRGDRLFPSENEIDPEELGEEIWRNCYVIQVRDIEMVEDYNYTYLGEAINEAYQCGMLDAHNTHIISPNARQLAHGFNQVIESKKPLIQNSSFQAADGHTVHYRQSMLPIGNSDDKVEAILGGMFFRKK